MNIKDILKDLNTNFTKQEECYEDSMSDCIEKYAMVKVKEGLDIDKHRWYETSIIVYKVNTNDGEKFIGVRACTDLFSEESSYDDIGWNLKYFEMKEKLEITYVVV